MATRGCFHNKDVPKCFVVGMAASEADDTASVECTLTNSQIDVSPTTSHTESRADEVQLRIPPLIPPKHADSSSLRDASSGKCGYARICVVHTSNRSHLAAITKRNRAEQSPSGRGGGGGEVAVVR